MAKILLLLGCLFASASQASDLIFMTGSRLHTYCSNFDDESLDRGLCQGYLTALVDAATTIQYLQRGHVNVCVTPEASPFQLRIVFMEWAAQHPDELSGAASSLALEAFADAYSCG